MDDKTYSRLRKRAIFSATRKGFAGLSEDLAHDAVVKWLEGRGQHQTVDQAIGDAIRGAFGRPDSPNAELRRNLEQRAEPMDALENRPGHSVTGDSLDDFERLIEPLGSIDRAICCLIYVWGFKEIEVGHCFGISESRVCQRLKGILESVSRAMERDKQRPDQIAAAKTEIDAWRQRTFELKVAGILSTKTEELERAADRSLEEKEFWSLEADHEEGIPEWFT